jgi:hypothetical protein
MQRWFGNAWAVVAAMSVLTALPARGGVFTQLTFSGDADSGISTSKTYTHAIDFNGSGDGYATLNINGVTFTSGDKGDQTATLKYSLGHPALNPFQIGTFGTNFDPGLSGSIDKMLRNFYYGNNADETLLLTGLTPNTTYAASFYGAAFGAKGGRYSRVTDSQGGLVFYDENQTSGTTTGSILRDTYTTGPGQTTMSFNWAIDTVDGVGNVTTNADSYHQYGFTNEVVPEPSALTLTGLAVAARLVRRRKAT